MSARNKATKATYEDRESHGEEEAGERVRCRMGSMSMVAGLPC